MEVIEDGHIELKVGCMFAEKTAAMNSSIRKHKIAGKECLCIKHVKDIRMDGDSEEKPLVASRDGTTSSAITSGPFLSELDESMIEKVDVIGIDEGQFFLDIATFAERWANRGKIVIITLLNGTFERLPFSEEVSELWAIAEVITKYYAVCIGCGKTASFSKRITDSKETILIGDSDYMAVCRKCFFK